MSAKELKNSTGTVIRTLRRGESILLSFRGKPLGTIEPLRPDADDRPAVRPYEETWPDLEAELQRSAPRFGSWQEAEDESRGRR
jgi:antitoxin (DNA-binding transcriptional repressor) of toxin-antitoxin stability system